MSQTLLDPVIDEIREVRHRISEEFGHDPERLLQHFLELQDAIRERLLATAEPHEASPVPARRADG